MVLFGYSVVFVGRTSSLQGGEPVCHDCLVLNGTIKLVIIYLHGTAVRVLTSGHPPESTAKVLTFGHQPGPLNTLSRTVLRTTPVVQQAKHQPHITPTPVLS